MPPLRTRTVVGVTVVILLAVCFALQRLWIARRSPTSQGQISARSSHRSESREPPGRQSVTPPKLGDADAARIEKLGDDISARRAEGRYAEAVYLAQESLAIQQTTHGDAWYETADARRLVETLQEITAMPAEAKEELARADGLGSEIDRLREEGRGVAALQLAEKQLAVRRKYLASRPTEIADTLNTIGALRLSLSRYEEAASALREALDIREATLGSEHFDAINTKRGLASTLGVLGRWAEAERLLREVLAVAQRSLGDEDFEVNRIRGALARVLYDAGRFEAEGILRETILKARRATGTDAELFLAEQLNMLGLLLSSRNELADAEKSCREALDLMLRYRNKSEKSGGLAIALSRLGNILCKKGEYVAADSLFREAMAIHRRNGKDQDVECAATLSEFATCRQAAGDDSAADRALEEAAAIRRAAYPREHWSSAWHLYTKGLFLYQRGEYGTAEPLLQEALSLSKKILGNDDPITANSLQTLADMLRVEGKFPEAEALAREALDQARRTFGENKPATAYRMGLLAHVLINLDDPAHMDETESLLQDSLRILEGSKNYKFLYQTKRLYAQFLWRRRHRLQEAEALYEELLHDIELRRTQVAGDELDRARYASAFHRGTAFKEMARLQLEFADTAHRESEGIRGERTARALGYLERARGRALLDLLDRGGQDAYRLAIERAQRLNDDELRAKTESLRKQETEARKTAHEIGTQIARLRADSAVTSEETERGIAELNKRQQGFRDAERQAARDLFELSRDDLQGRGLQPLTAAQVSAALQTDELMLVYDTSARDCLVFVVQPQGRIDASTLEWPDGRKVNTESLGVAVGEALAELSRANKQDLGSPHSGVVDDDLFSALVPSQWRQKVAEAARVVVVADGQLHLLPFEMLVADSTSGRRWIDSGPAIVYSPSATVLVNRRERAEWRRQQFKEEPNRRVLVAVGDPTFSDPSSEPAPGTMALASSYESLIATGVRDATGSAFGRLEPLPGTAAEVTSIADTIRKSTAASNGAVLILLGQDATVTNLHRVVSGPRFFHLATHGLIDDGRRAYESALAFTSPEAVTNEDTGFLRLADLLSSWGGKLDGTELVTLSACRTARGALERGEGFVALTWGFLFAGAESVIASLWKVDDTATALLMVRLYENLMGAFSEPREAARKTYSAHEPMSKADALCEAKRWLATLPGDKARELAEGIAAEPRERGGSFVTAPPKRESSDRPYADPFYWAAFVLIGDGS